MTSGIHGAQLLAEATATLEAAGIGSPRTDAEWLLSHITGTSRTDVHRHEVSAAQRTAYEDMVARRAQRVPLQYVTGTAAFRFCELHVGPGVFIPRPETESVAGWVIERARTLPAPVVVDLCTGSGAIARAVHDEVAAADVYAVEIDDAAVYWARRNLDGTNVDLRHADIADALYDLDGRADIVVTNPPYVPTRFALSGSRESLDAEVRDHDPGVAIWGGPDGLDYLRRVEPVARRLLHHNGTVAVEHDSTHQNTAMQIFGSGQIFTSGWHEVCGHRDLAGKPRFVTAMRQRPAR